MQFFSEWEEDYSWPEQMNEELGANSSSDEENGRGEQSHVPPLPLPQPQVHPVNTAAIAAAAEAGSKLAGPATTAHLLATAMADLIYWENPVGNASILGFVLGCLVSAVAAPAIQYVAAPYAPPTPFVSGIPPAAPAAPAAAAAAAAAARVVTSPRATTPGASPFWVEFSGGQREDTKEVR